MLVYNKQLLINIHGMKIQVSVGAFLEMASITVIPQIMCLVLTRMENSLNIWQRIISGFHRALLQPITFISRLNALDYTKLRN